MLPAAQAALALMSQPIKRQAAAVEAAAHRHLRATAAQEAQAGFTAQAAAVAARLSTLSETLARVVMADRAL